jgi:hypothetical protein
MISSILQYSIASRLPYIVSSRANGKENFRFLLEFAKKGGGGSDVGIGGEGLEGLRPQENFGELKAGKHFRGGSRDVYRTAARSPRHSCRRRGEEWVGARLTTEPRLELNPNIGKRQAAVANGSQAQTESRLVMVVGTRRLPLLWPKAIKEDLGLEGLRPQEIHGEGDDNGRSLQIGCSGRKSAPAIPQRALRGFDSRPPFSYSWPKAIKKDLRLARKAAAQAVNSEKVRTWHSSGESRIWQNSDAHKGSPLDSAPARLLAIPLKMICGLTT